MKSSSKSTIKVTKIEIVAKKVEIPAPVLRHIAHLNRSIKQSLRASDYKSATEFENRLIAYKKANGIL